MKRKITDLEQYLKDNEYKLIGKTYQGKDSQFTMSYIYSKETETTTILLYLNKSRNGIYDIAIDKCGVMFSQKDIYDINDTLEQTQDLIERFFTKGSEINA